MRVDRLPAASPRRAPRSGTRSAALILLSLALGAGCATSVAPDPGLEGLALDTVGPTTIVAGTTVVIKGASFVDEQWGAAVLHLSGDGVDVRWPATFVDFNTLNAKIDAARMVQIGGERDFHGTAQVEVIATSDNQQYTSNEKTLDLSFRNKLEPVASSLAVTGVIFVNDRIEVDGDGFLLGGDEGVSVAKLTGCFTADGGGTCDPIADIELDTQPVDPLQRDKIVFPFSPKVAGIKPGTFTGQVTIINHQSDRPVAEAAPLDASYDLVTAQIFSVDPPAAALGQYVFVRGGGFVGGEASALTELELAGTFNKTGKSPVPVQMTLIPEFVEGRLVRYVVNTDDELGQALDLRHDTGHFSGTITPVVSFGADRVRGVTTNAAFDLAPMKQVVFLQFQPSYIEGLRDYGLRAVHKQIVDRIVAVCNRTYQGVNIDFRTEPVTDFALYENVELVGVDPNDQGLFGYDNSPGKDNGNLRLYDRLGGVNALTQQDGFPGYGGVFVRSLMGFSKHPGSFAKTVPGADDTFDKTFDEFRADQGGDPVTSSDLKGGIEALADGSSCPGGDRKHKVACAVYVLGNLVGGTLAHEIGHSLGLANPFMDGFHDAGDAPNRLMDAGGDRSFLERAELQGEGPAVFCDDEYAYLRQIMPKDEAPPNVTRPSCF
jgi:hypothetical protein